MNHSYDTFSNRLIGGSTLFLYETLGGNAKSSRFNIFVDKDGSLWLQENGSDIFIETWEFITGR